MSNLPGRIDDGEGLQQSGLPDRRDALDPELARIADMLAEGVRLADVASSAGMTRQQVVLLELNPVYREYLAARREEFLKGVRARAVARIHALADKALDTVETVMAGNGEKQASSMLAAANSIVDRVVQKKETDKTGGHLDVTITIEDAARMKSAIIDVDAISVPNPT